jgi:hypothetical protein
MAFKEPIEDVEVTRRDAGNSPVTATAKDDDKAKKAFEKEKEKASMKKEITVKESTELIVKALEYIASGLYDKDGSSHLDSVRSSLNSGVPVYRGGLDRDAWTKSRA